MGMDMYIVGFITGTALSGSIMLFAKLLTMGVGKKEEN